MRARVLGAFIPFPRLALIRRRTSTRSPSLYIGTRRVGRPVPPIPRSFVLVFWSFGLRRRSQEFKELEIVVLRHELFVLRRQVARPQLEPSDRVLNSGSDLPRMSLRHSSNDPTSSHQTTNHGAVMEQSDGKECHEEGPARSDAPRVLVRRREAPRNVVRRVGSQPQASRLPSPRC